ncbi:dethiobiotin synthase [Anaerofustis stercorihominis]|uniref:ATP-dependent dethiobiotin synthetase BioD n=1 Tax=Anaerofustis stercorihominis DSM 17244 TaxID=445971 RepID=B1CC61_9FIRM|nr:dethiobiotin synthase [Anaerofustis stercorihominis]EDS71858.1 dethiobiotin synthase [Anaerofustis stercorihominis DSM 17244]MCQ4796089.1 dethiobiotin synthase [Anaerofustis stercorihominis]
MSKGIFITATGTDMGKTYISGLILKKLMDKGYNAGYYKAAISGAVKENGKFISSDAHYVNEVSGLNEDIDNIVSYMYESEVSPHLAQKIEGNKIDLNKIKSDYNNIKTKYDYVLVEGSGGIVCPIRYDDKCKIMLEDIIKMLELNVLVITKSSLGSINDTVLTCEYLKRKNINVEGIIMNGYQEDNILHVDNKNMIEELTGIDVIIKVKGDCEDMDISCENLLKLFK